MKNIFATIKIVTLGLVLAIGVSYVSAAGGWAGPSTGPTGGNIEPPVNVSASNQVKSGTFGVGPTLNLSGAMDGILAAQRSVLSFGSIIAAGTSNVGGNIYAGLPSLTGNYSGVHNNGAISADWFCLPAAGGGCINSWSGVGGSGAMPTGTITQTLRHDGTKWTASNALLNDGTNLIISTGGLRVGNAGGLMPPAGGILVNGLIKTSGNTTATTNGDIGASRFCLPGTNPNGGCISTWPIATGGGALPAGTSDQTLRNTGGTTYVADSNLKNNGTNVTIGGNATSYSYGRLSVNKGSISVDLAGGVGAQGTDALILNGATGIGNVAVVTNQPLINFWNSPGNTNANIAVRDLYAYNDARVYGNAYVTNTVGAHDATIVDNVTAGGTVHATVLEALDHAQIIGLAPGGNVCADATGVLYVCPATPPPAAATGQTCGLYNNQPTTGDGTHFGCPNGSALVQISANGQTGTCRYYDPGVTTGSTAVPNNGTPYCYNPGNLLAGIIILSTNELQYGCAGDTYTLRGTATNAIGSVTYHWSYSTDPDPLHDGFAGPMYLISATNQQNLSFHMYHYERTAPASYTPVEYTYTLTITDSAGRTASTTFVTTQTRAPATGSTGLPCFQ